MLIVDCSLKPLHVCFWGDMIKLMVLIGSCEFERFKIVCSYSCFNQMNFMFPSLSIQNIKSDVLGKSNLSGKVSHDVHSFNRKYSLNSIATCQIDDNTTLRVEICGHETYSGTGTNMIFTCIQYSPEWVCRRKFLGKLIESYIKRRFSNGEGRLGRLKAKIMPQPDQMFLVRYPTWKDVSIILKRVKGEGGYDELMKRGFYDNFIHEYGKRHTGRWFRGAFVRTISGCSPVNPELSIFNLIDAGRNMIIPANNVYAITPRFLIPPQLSLNLSICVDGVRQYTPSVEKWLNSILFPGRRIKIRVVATAVDVSMVQIIEPLLSLEDLAIWESKSEESSIRKEVMGKMQDIVNSTLDVRDAEKIKGKCQELLNEHRKNYIAELAMNRNLYGSDPKRYQLKAGLPLFFMSMEPEM